MAKNQYDHDKPEKFVLNFYDKKAYQILKSHCVNSRR